MFYKLLAFFCGHQTDKFEVWRLVSCCEDKRRGHLHSPPTPSVTASSSVFPFLSYMTQVCRVCVHGPFLYLLANFP